ncbi:MAG: hypothetical protein GWM98_24560, partial [Nitrospinaceae bacterium]|nr:hypothetical protein [Nitrospinaceae bacterium]NIR57051.1 hypothetical protein [Nitrospinaceae bacterium]NIT84362.1 hypothetical protein [Nitrospinaceae bacterium]NIU46549.1 hypothetical protein [Nitrospinaceae bacterium]NIU98741.1 hypothetical protein [Nitrospinaceae bacterium]
MEDSVQTGLETLRNFLNDETGRWIIAPHAEAQSEYPLTGYLEGRYKN